MGMSIGVRRRGALHVSRLGLFYIILLVYTVLTCVPFVWSLLTSFKSLPEAAQVPPTGIPLHPTASAWQVVLGLKSLGFPVDFLTYFKNSVIVAVVVMLGNLFFDSLAGYAFARMRFPGRNFLFYLVLATLMVPVAMTIVPVYIILAKVPGFLGGPWIATYQGLTIPFLVTAFGIFMMRQFFMQLPIELEEAGRMDGLTRFGMYRRIALPLSKPALATLAILQFQGSWDSFLMPQVITAGVPSMYTLPVGLANFSFGYVNYTPEIMAGALVVILPILIVYIFAQRYIIEGLSRTGLKG
ncbi:MAG TPA: carbohydrate ABC transporter permease [Chloroflexota bacterium]|nr:carbohydrate ABC transporter permease [Chloroflexota bacterium]